MPQKHEYLSKNQQIVLSIIEKAKGPLKAYSILYNVQKKGIKAPLQVYRALEKLIEIGKIHKIESKNAFIACKNSDCEISKATAFSICNNCEHVKEIKNTKLLASTTTTITTNSNSNIVNPTAKSKAGS